MSWALSPGAFRSVTVLLMYRRRCWQPSCRICLYGCRVLHRARQQLPHASWRRNPSPVPGYEDNPSSRNYREHGVISKRGSRVSESVAPKRPSLDPVFALPFPEAALPILRDPQVRKNVAHATDVIQAKRAKLVIEKKDWEQLRAAASAIRDHTLENLDKYLEEFELRCTAAGGIVHWASDASEARQIILDLLRQENASEVIKIKTMTSAEIQLNPFLQAAGIEIFETDLAEIILQLGEEEPSHIVVPALHMNRSQVREIFSRRMGLDGLSDDPEALTAAARNYLREKFLKIPTAIGGANFLIAESGSVVVVESEGNGRMCLTLPRTLITLAGIEKVLPRFRDLEVMLQVLARSATGERMNPYTSLWTGTMPGDGPQRFHVVLLDNGRSSILAQKNRTPDTKVHSVRRMHQYLPSVSADGRTRLRFSLSRTNRRNSYAAIGKDEACAISSLRFFPLWRMLRSVPGQNQHTRGSHRTSSTSG